MAPAGIFPVEMCDTGDGRCGDFIEDDGPVPVADDVLLEVVGTGLVEDGVAVDDPITVLDVDNIRAIGGPSEHSQEPGLFWNAEPGERSKVYPLNIHLGRRLPVRTAQTIVFPKVNTSGSLSVHNYRIRSTTDPLCCSRTIATHAPLIIRVLSVHEEVVRIQQAAYSCMAHCPYTKHQRLCD